ncbi:hypothetical protein AMST5_00475 [freshwater sediment metagenome]|jgi:hypothetical protein|uniref:Uncharacterized protein n=1 Tax=freshwater sediment metagenome TaxID=556182 RepID=A0AA48RCU9_9ZZZZ
MPAPMSPEFLAMTGAFVQGSDEVYSSIEEMVDSGWHCLTKKQHPIAKAYLDELLSGKYGEEELRALWLASNASVNPFRGSEGSCREFLELMRSRYEKFDRSLYID